VIYLIHRKFQYKQQVAESNMQIHLLLSKVNMSSAYWIVAGIAAFVFFSIRNDEVCSQPRETASE
jgi:hypothetical protein